MMKRSGIDKIIDVSNFSNHEVLIATGVPDHVLYDKCISVFDIVSTPFFAVILSGSDHAPFAIPQNINFKPQHKDKRKNIVAYADWSIGNFLKHA